MDHLELANSYRDYEHRTLRYDGGSSAVGGYGETNAGYLKLTAQGTQTAHGYSGELNYTNDVTRTGRRCYMNTLQVFYGDLSDSSQQSHVWL